MGATDPRILVVEDDPSVQEALGAALRGDGYEVETAADGTAVPHLLESFRPDLAVLDVRLPDGPDGFAVARTIRQTSDIPILFLSALGELRNRLEGFDAGGDDYVVKPFSMAELLARVRALLRLAGRLASPVWEMADLMVDEGARQVVRAGEEIELTRTEFDVLAALGRTPGQVVSKERLLSLVWGFGLYDTNVVEVHISALRRKLEEHGSRLIHTVRGVGYVLRP